MTTNVITFLRTQEEAKNDVSNAFQMTTPVATVTDLTAAFDATTNEIVATMTGTGFGSDTSAVQLWIDGVQQKTETVASTTATFTVTHLDHESANKVDIYFADGLPDGYTSFKTLTVTPNLVSITPSTGSAGGTKLRVTGTGFGKNT